MGCGAQLWCPAPPEGRGQIELPAGARVIDAVFFFRLTFSSRSTTRSEVKSKTLFKLFKKNIILKCEPWRKTSEEEEEKKKKAGGEKNAEIRTAIEKQ